MCPIIYIALPSYVVFAVIGGFISLLFLYFRTEKYGISFLDFAKMFAISLVFCFLGSRLTFVFSRLPWLLGNFSVRNLISTIFAGGLVYYGGLLGILLGIYLYCKRQGLSTKNMYNMVTPAIPLFHAFGRIGCFMAGCCYGLEVKTSFSLFGIATLTRIPTQLIEALFEILLFIVLFTLQRKNCSRNYLKIYMITYAVFRFIIEFFRGDLVRGFYFGYSTSQIIAISILVFYFIKCLWSHRVIKNAKDD